MSKPKTLSDEDTLKALASVFMEHGFGGATLSLFASATGLKRASLYHRFPDGKLDMALAVAQFSREHFFGEVLAPLTRDGDPQERVKETARNMQRFYDAGNTSCLMDSLSIGAKGTDREAIDEAVSEMFKQFISALTKAAKDFGANTTRAKRLAEDAIVRLEGSLVVARGTGNSATFRRTLKDLPALLAGKNNQ